MATGDKATGAAVKKRGRGGKYNFPNSIPPGAETPDTIRAVLTEAMRWYDRGQERPTTDDEIWARSREYFEACISRGVRPTVEAYCLALGYARQTVHEWRTGRGCSPRRTDIIKKCFDTFAAFDAGMAVEGELNPILYIFRGKNYYNLRDTQDVVVTPSSPLQADISVEEVAAKYAELPED